MYGDLEQDGDRWRLRFVRRLPHPPEKVWRAITEPEHLAAWFPADIHGERRAGAPLLFEFRRGEGPPTSGRMITFEPPTLVEFQWEDDVLRFELQPDDGGRGTVLTFLDTFGELGKAARDASGWHACLDVLEHDIAGGALPWTPEERWKDVHDYYVEHLPAEASTIGPPEGA